jgi:serine/threonine protein kinase
MACPCIVSMSSVFQDQRIVMLEYDDLIMCDLALAIANNALSTPEAKIYYAACIYLGLSKVHESGLMHRFINSGSVYISSIGVPKVKQPNCCSFFGFSPAAALISIVGRPPVLQEDGWPKSFHHLRRPVVFCTRDRQSARI